MRVRRRIPWNAWARYAAIGATIDAIFVLFHDGPLAMLGFLLSSAWISVMVAVGVMTGIAIVRSRRTCECGHHMVWHKGELMGGPCQYVDLHPVIQRCDCQGRALKVPAATARRAG